MRTVSNTTAIQLIAIAHRAARMALANAYRTGDSHSAANWLANVHEAMRIVYTAPHLRDAQRVIKVMLGQASYANMMVEQAFNANYWMCALETCNERANVLNMISAHIK